jgi:hypothetical protein
MLYVEYSYSMLGMDKESQNPNHRRRRSLPPEKLREIKDLLFEQERRVPRVRNGKRINFSEVSRVSGVAGSTVAYIYRNLVTTERKGEDQDPEPVSGTHLHF